ATKSDVRAKSPANLCLFKHRGVIRKMTRSMRGVFRRGAPCADAANAASWPRSGRTAFSSSIDGFWSLARVQVGHWGDSRPARQSSELAFGPNGSLPIRMASTEGTLRVLALYRCAAPDP